MVSIAKHAKLERTKVGLTNYLMDRGVDHIDLLEDRELLLILNTMGNAQTALDLIDNDADRVEYLKDLIKILIASSVLQAKAMFLELEG